MMNPRRYLVKMYHFGERVLPKETILVGLDLSSGYGIQAAHVEMDRMFGRITQAARIQSRDLKHCRIEVVDEESQAVVYNFYPPTE